MIGDYAVYIVYLSLAPALLSVQFVFALIRYVPEILG